MDEKIIKSLRRKMTSLVVFAAVLALIGAIGIFVIQGISAAGNLKSDSAAIITLIALILWDLVRMGSFGMFGGSLIMMVCELFGKVRGKYCSLIMLGGSVFGFVGVFMLSFQSMLREIFTTSITSSINSHYTSTGIAGYSFVNTPCIFAIVSAVVIFVALGIRSSRVNAVYTAPQYPQQYQQQYFQQFPQQYPQQAQQQYPQQASQQYPQQDTQQYPQQDTQQYPQQDIPQYPQQNTQNTDTPNDTNGDNNI